MSKAVIVGSGVGGMAAAAYLAQAGLEVLVLEQAEHFGGYSNPFFREGFQFDPGIHYVGECRAGHLVHALLGGVGIDATALFAELDPDGFDVYRFPDFEVRMCRGLHRYRERLRAVFPKEARGLGRLFDLVESSRIVMSALVSAQSDGLHFGQLRALPRLPSIVRSMTRRWGDLLASFIGDARLRAVLSAAGGDIGLPPGRASAYAGLGLLAHYADGAFFPRGGSAALRDALVGAATRHGARFRARARVARILTRDRGAVGVMLAGGERIEADVVVSDADPVLTFGQLVDPEALPGWLRERARRTEETLGSFAVYLGMRRDLRQRGLGRFDVWQLPDYDLDALYAPLFAGELPREPFFFLSPNSLKDDTGALAPAGSSTLEVITLVPYALFARWRDRPAGGRGPDYEAEKRRVADWLLEAVERKWPGLVGDVAVQEISTPLTNEWYTLAVRGAAYGPALTPAQSGWRRFGTTTPVRNLFLAGAGVLGDGVAPCLASGRIAARLAARAVGAVVRRPRARLREAPA